MTHRFPHLVPFLLIALGTAAPATAAPIQWTLTDIIFEDGSSASGSFVYDADLDAYSSILITTTSGDSGAGASYASLLLGGNADAAFVPSDTPDLSGSALLQLVFSTPLTNDGGIVFLTDVLLPSASSFEATCLNPDCSAADFGRTMVEGGLVGAQVPAPAVAPLLGAAFAGLLARSRRRSRAG